MKQLASRLTIGGFLLALLLWLQPLALSVSPLLGRNVAYWWCAAGLFLLAGVGGSYRAGRIDWQALCKQDVRSPVIFAFLLYGAALWLTSRANMGFHYDHVRQYIALACPLILPFAASQRSHTDWWWLGCALGAVVMATISSYEVFMLGEPRARGYHFWVSWGALGLTMGILPLSAQPPGWQHGWRKGILYLAAAAGVATAILSGSRLTWLAAGAILAWRLGRRSCRAALFASVGALCALLLSSAVPAIAARWQMFGQDLHQYATGDADTSTGLRLVMWREALGAWQQHPWLGVGTEGFHAWLVGAARLGRGPATLQEHGHAHSEILNALASGGILGLVATALVFLLPWWAFSRFESNSPDAPTATAARAGKTLILAFALIGLGDTLLVHFFLLSWYTAVVMLMLGWCRMRADS
ncbi:MAG: O-antigen ligase family protein [Burkholderiales bacterium]|nr:O-antigen ligase family protein [Burkholderiales bacterium]